MEARQRIKAEIAPEEWDFRKVKADDLRSAILYEYARATPWIVQKFQSWHQQHIKLPKQSQHFRQWNGTNVKAVLDLLKHDELPPDIADALHKTLPEWLFEPPFDEIADVSSFFPAPFLALPHNTQAAQQPGPAPSPAVLHYVELARQLYPEPVRHGFRELPSLPPRPLKQIEREKQMGLFRVAVEIDLRVGKTQVVSDFRKWLGGFQSPALTGRAATAPWHELKELAAYRLSRLAHLSYDKAQEFISQHLCEHREVSTKDVLPHYSSSGAWWSAVKSAALRIKTLYPRTLAKL